MTTKPPPKAQREQLANLLAEANAGRLPWLDRLVSDAGYDHPEKLSRKAIAGICGVTPKTVGQWIERGCPTRGKRTIALTDVAAWLAERVQALATESKRDRAPGLEEAEYNRILEESGLAELPDESDPYLQQGSSFYQELGRKRAAELARIKVDQERGHLIDQGDAMRQWRAILLGLRTRMEQTARDLCPDCAAILTRNYNEGLDALDIDPEPETDGDDT